MENDAQTQSLTEILHTSKLIDRSSHELHASVKGVMDRPEECNRAVLVSVATFDSGVPLEKRSGANRDAKKLHRILTKLGFKVELHMDPSSKEIYNLFSEGNRSMSTSELSDSFIHSSPEGFF